MLKRSLNTLENSSVKKHENRIRVNGYVKQKTSFMNKQGLAISKKNVCLLFLSLILILLIFSMLVFFSSKKFVEHDDENIALVEIKSFDKDLQIHKNNIKLISSNIPVLIFCHDRYIELNRTLNSVYESLKGYMKRRSKNSNNISFTIYVSQDGKDARIKELIQFQQQRFNKHPLYNRSSIFKYINFEYTGKKIVFKSQLYPIYKRISSHYNQALNEVFNINLISTKYERIILLEDDMDISLDFFDFFAALQHLFDADPSLYCISAQNDNGQKQLVKYSDKLQRTNVFPGLGQMMPITLQKELRSKQPEAYQDEFMRLPEQLNQRTCIYPEINRVFTFGVNGSSQGQFYNKYIKSIKLNDQIVNFNKLNLSYIIEPNYSNYIIEMLNKAVEVWSIPELNRIILDDEKSIKNSVNLPFKIIYNNIHKFNRFANYFNLFLDHKNGLPRTSYNGVVQFRYRNRLVFISPAIFNN